MQFACRYAKPTDESLGFGVSNMGRIETSGPIFDGVAERQISEWCNNLEERLANDARDELDIQFHDTFKHATGYYEAHVQVHSDPDGHVVSDGGVIYGPWLEGTGSRNAPHTRFKGYANFRRVTASINRKTTRVAQEMLPALLRRIG